jgi:hypothetical protein
VWQSKPPMGASIQAMQRSLSGVPEPTLNHPRINLFIHMNTASSSANPVATIS